MSVEGGGEGRVEERRCIKEALRRERSCTVFVSTGSFSGERGVTSVEYRCEE